jgi:tellurite methyltransferase
MDSNDLREQFGDIDIYLFDQLLRGRIRSGMRIVDAGCGGGRNLVYLLRNGFDVSGNDTDRGAIESVRAIAARLAPHLPARNFRVEPIEAMSFPDGCADVVIASAVLHFAADDAQFDAMVASLWRVLAPGGILFARLASSIGIADRLQPVGGRRFLLPDGSERYLVDEATLLQITARLGAELLDPIKTTVVQDQRAMTTWVVGKRRGSNLPRDEHGHRGHAARGRS